MRISTFAETIAGVFSVAASAQAATPLYGFQLGDTSEALSAAELASFLGAPDDMHTGIGAGFITYDLGDYRLIDGAGQDFNVYEVDFGAVEFNLLNVLVSANNLDYFNVNPSAAAALSLVGDGTHSNASFRKSYDVGAAVTALSATQFRYIRLQGTGSGGISGNNGFDPDAIGVANYVNLAAIPEPATWSMMIMGFGLAGGLLRRRKTTMA